MAPRGQGTVGGWAMKLGQVDSNSIKVNDKKGNDFKKNENWGYPLSILRISRKILEDKREPSKRLMGTCLKGFVTSPGLSLSMKGVWTP